MTDDVFISVVIPTYNSKDRLKNTVKSLCKQTYPKEQYEVIIVDDGSTDGTGEWVGLQQNKSSCILRYFFQKNKGPASARNIGVRYSRGSVVAFIDSDCIASPTWIAEIAKGYDNERIAGVGGRIKASPTASRVSRYCAYVNMNDSPFIDTNGIVYLITSNASFKKVNLDKVGGFDERYNFPGGEDVDLCRRIRRQGYIFKYNRDAVVYNPHKERLSGFIMTYFNYGKGEAFLHAYSSTNQHAIYKSGVIRFFLEIICLLARHSLTYLNLIVKFLKIPLKALFFYGQGLNMKDSFFYASLDYGATFSFIQGRFFGYFVVKFKGSKDTVLNPL